MSETLNTKTTAELLLRRVSEQSWEVGGVPYREAEDMVSVEAVRAEGLP